ncbi:hypothetical protein E2C01_021461 [Portunus trituberculatus]|uniref:Uncharacterized protein n=1 Tax=Portunus trituberculatus TaxID=210409 RepID=A0A5B7E2K8_PORTR|nr:hypothetical protein [Portunus trituberculatus]
MSRHFTIINNQTCSIFSAGSNQHPPLDLPPSPPLVLPPPPLGLLFYSFTCSFSSSTWFSLSSSICSSSSYTWSFISFSSTSSSFSFHHTIRSINTTAIAPTSTLIIPKASEGVYILQPQLGVIIHLPTPIPPPPPRASSPTPIATSARRKVMEGGDGRGKGGVR